MFFHATKNHYWICQQLSVSITVSLPCTRFEQAVMKHTHPYPRPNTNTLLSYTWLNCHNSQSAWGPSSDHSRISPTLTIVSCLPNDLPMHLHTSAIHYRPPAEQRSGASPVCHPDAVHQSHTQYWSSSWSWLKMTPVIRKKVSLKVVMGKINAWKSNHITLVFLISQ